MSALAEPSPIWLQRLRRGAYCALLALLLWAPLPLGSNRAWALALLAMLLSVLLLVVVSAEWFAASGSPDDAGAGRGAARIIWWPAACLLAFACLVALQLAPLPDALLRALSPIDGPAQPVSLEPQATRVYLLSCVAYLSAFSLVLLLVRTPKRARGVMLLLVASGVFQAILAVVLISQNLPYQYMFMDFPAGDRAVGTFANTDHFAAYMTLGLSLGLGLMLGGGADASARRGWRAHTVGALEFLMSPRMLVRLLLVMMVIGLVLTRSRGGNAAFLAALLVTSALVAWRSPRLRRTALILLVSMLVIDVYVVGQWIGLDKVAQRLGATTVLKPDAPALGGAPVQGGVPDLAAPNIAREESLEERLIAARDALGMLKERPWLGFGGGSFYTAFPRFKGAHPLGFYDHAHNDYVEIAADMGLPALALLLVVAVASLARAIGVLSDRSAPMARGMAAGVVMAILCTAIHSAVDFNLQIPANALTVTVVLALAWCLPATPRHGARGAGRRSGAERA
jgi:hypothetical protein